MRAPSQTFAEAVDAVRQQRDPGHKDPFFDRIRRCTGLPRPRTPNSYLELAGSLFVARCVAEMWPKRPKLEARYRQKAIRKRDAIRLLLKESWLAPATREDLERQEPVYAALAHDPGVLLDLGWVEEYGLPKRRDHLTLADLGRKFRGAGRELFIREVSRAMRDIFGKPHDKIVGRITGLAFNGRPLTADAVRDIRRRKTGLVRLK
jgi:hypothetical protein